MADDLRHRYARLEYEQGQLWDLVDQVHVGPVSPDKDLLAAIAATIAQATDAWRERAEKAEQEAEHRRLAYNAANAMAGVHKRRADRLKAELEHAKGALAGDSEAMAAFMADHAEVLARAREQRDMWQRATEQAEAAIDRAHALAQRWAHEPHPTHDHLCPDDLRRDLLAALDDIPETGRG